jgi:DNA-binding MarR family transcriptional regulator
VPPATTDELADAMVNASRALVAIAARSLAVAPSDVTLPQYRVLVVLATRGPQRPSDLAAELNVAGSSITRMSDRLVRKRLVLRRAHRDDRRELHIEITDAGRAIVDTVTAVRRRDIGRLVARVPQRQRGQLLRMLQALADAADDDPPTVSPLGWPV